MEKHNGKASPNLHFILTAVGKNLHCNLLPIFQLKVAMDAYAYYIIEKNNDMCFLPTLQYNAIE